MKEAAPTRLVIGLFDSGLTPLLRAGLGGLAAAVRKLDSGVLEELGSIDVSANQIVLDWRESGKASKFLEALFGECFRIEDGLIRLLGSFDAEPTFETRVELSEVLRLTFLQHGSSAKKQGAPVARTFEFEDEPRPVLVQSYREFVHQTAWKDIGKALDVVPSKATPIALAGWANPGAAERHVGLGGTQIQYTAAEALCACFAMVGCVSFKGPSRSGVLVVPEPADLVAFARVRPRLCPDSARQCTVASAGDGALTIHAALRAASLRDLAKGVSNISAVELRATQWATQQKSRTDGLLASRYSEAELNAFHRLYELCPPRLLPTKPKKKGEAGGYWAVPSSLRGFVADNLSRHNAFYHGFATARTRDNPPRWLHRFHTKDDDLGALRFPDDKKGIIAMIETLGEAERLLVTSVHTALRQRFGAIWQENKDNTTAAKKRSQGEREKWRLAFSGARTHEQIRHALADLWSRAGSIKELKGDGWVTLQPLLAETKWEAARDLALIALASYQGKEVEDTATITEEA